MEGVGWYGYEFHPTLPESFEKIGILSYWVKNYGELKRIVLFKSDEAEVMQSPKVE